MDNDQHGLLLSTSFWLPTQLPKCFLQSLSSNIKTVTFVNTGRELEYR